MNFERKRGKERVEERRVQALERKKEYDALSLPEKIDKMTMAPGDSKKQTTKLVAQLHKQRDEKSKKKGKRTEANKS